MNSWWSNKKVDSKPLEYQDLQDAYKKAMNNQPLNSRTPGVFIYRCSKCNCDILSMKYYDSTTEAKLLCISCMPQPQVKMSGAGVKAGGLVYQHICNSCGSNFYSIHGQLSGIDATCGNCKKGNPERQKVLVEYTLEDYDYNLYYKNAERLKRHLNSQGILFDLNTRIIRNDATHSTTYIQYENKLSVDHERYEKYFIIFLEKYILSDNMKYDIEHEKFQEQNYGQQYYSYATSTQAAVYASYAHVTPISSPYVIAPGKKRRNYQH